MCRNNRAAGPGGWSQAQMCSSSSKTLNSIGLDDKDAKTVRNDHESELSADKNTPVRVAKGESTSSFEGSRRVDLLRWLHVLAMHLLPRWRTKNKHVIPCHNQSWKPYKEGRVHSPFRPLINSLPLNPYLPLTLNHSIITIMSDTGRQSLTDKAGGKSFNSSTHRCLIC